MTKKERRPKRFRRWAIRLAAAAIVVVVVLRVWPGLVGGNDLAGDELVVWYPTIAHREGGDWVVPIHGCVYEPETDDLWRSAFIGVLRRTLGIKGSHETELFRRRVGCFLVDHQRGRRLRIRVGRRTITLPVTRANGHVKYSIRVPVASTGKRELIFDTVMSAGDERSFAGTVHLVPRKGLSIVSDIDDTVKISQVTDKKQLLRNTFLEEFRAVPGMADKYREWMTAAGARLHFVSSSPWQLYPELLVFLAKAGFPPASFHLNTVRLQDETVLELFADPFASKLAKIAPLFEQFPERRFVLVGDSGEKDPEVYGEIARRYTRQVVRIFIRNVTGEKPRAKRFRDAFATLPDDTWLVFDDPKQLVLPR